MLKIDGCFNKRGSKEETDIYINFNRPAFGKRCNKCGIISHFARACKGETRRKQQSHFVDDDPEEEVFAVNCQALPIGSKKFFAHWPHSRKLLKLKFIRRRLVTPCPV